jgi:uncharacterized membrane protein YhhN
MAVPAASRIPRSFRLLYLTLVLAELTALLLAPRFPGLHLFTKPLIVLSLIGLVSQKRLAGEPRVQKRLLQGALVTSLLGDVMLLFEAFFLLGLSAFFLAHACYLLLFVHSVQRADPSTPAPLLWRHPWLLLPFLATEGLLFHYLAPGLGDFWLPVLCYATIITLMNLAALNRWQRVPDVSFARVMTGGLLFMVSDSLIAIERFGPEALPLPWPSIWIMTTYTAAQYLLVTGMLAVDSGQ